MSLILYCFFVCLLFFTVSTFLKAIKHELETIECPLDRDYHEDPFTSFLFWNESTTDSFLEGIQTVTPFLEESVGVSTSPSSPFLESEGMREDLSLTPSPTILEEKGERVESMSDSLYFLEGEREDDPMSASFLEEVRSGGRSLSFLVSPTQPYSSTFLDEEVIWKGVSAASSYFLARTPSPRSCLVVVENMATNVTFLH